MARTVLCALLLLSQGSRRAADVSPVPEPARDHFYREDHYTGADYLRLGRDGRYETTGVEHMGRWALDSGRWEVLGDRVVLHSDARVREIVTREYRVFIPSFDDVAWLKSLRSAVASFLAERRDAWRFTAAEVKSIRTPWPGRLSVDVEVGAELGRAPLTRATLRTLIDAIDAYLAEPDTRSFAYRLLRHRGFTVFYCLDPGGAAVFQTPAEIREAIDRDPAVPPPYLYLEVTPEVFSKGVGRNYPFKYFPEMNPPDGP